MSQYFRGLSSWMMNFLSNRAHIKITNSSNKFVRKSERVLFCSPINGSNKIWMLIKSTNSCYPLPLPPSYNRSQALMKKSSAFFAFGSVCMNSHKSNFNCWVWMNKNSVQFLLLEAAQFSHFLAMKIKKKMKLFNDEWDEKVTNCGEIMRIKLAEHSKRNRWSYTLDALNCNLFMSERINFFQK